MSPLRSSGATRFAFSRFFLAFVVSCGAVVIKLVASENKLSRPLDFRHVAQSHETVVHALFSSVSVKVLLGRFRKRRDASSVHDCNLFPLLFSCDCFEYSLAFPFYDVRERLRHSANAFPLSGKFFASSSTGESFVAWKSYLFPFIAREHISLKRKISVSYLIP